MRLVAQWLAEDHHVGHVGPGGGAGALRDQCECGAGRLEGLRCLSDVAIVTYEVEQHMYEAVINVEQAVAVVCMLIQMAVKKVSVIYIIVVTVEYKLILDLLSL